MTTGLLITTAGRNAIIADLGGGADLVLTDVAWGDANGVPYNPNQAQVALVNEKYRAAIASVAVVGGAIVVDAVIPADTDDGSGRPSHGFSVAEVGLFSSAGTLIGVARCGNGYKPPPSSGQAHDVTYRLKLAVANPSAITVIIEPQAQIAIGRQVRPFWLTVDGVLNDPPAAPDPGATYVVGPAPTGAWAGFAHRLVQWAGVWVLAEAPLGHQVVDFSKGVNAGARWLERTAGGWAPGISRLVQKQPGNYVVAGGTANALAITLDPVPETLADLDGVPLRIKTGAAANSDAVTLKANGLAANPVRGPDGLDLLEGELPPNTVFEVVRNGAWFQITNRPVPSALRSPAAFSMVTGAAQAIAQSTATVVANFAPVRNDTIDSVLAANQITIGAKDAGWWVVTGKLMYDFPASGTMMCNLIIERNGVEIGAGNAAGTSNIRARPQAAAVYKLEEGDVINLRTSTDTARSLTSGSSIFSGFKVGA